MGSCSGSCSTDSVGSCSTISGGSCPTTSGGSCSTGSVGSCSTERDRSKLFCVCNLMQLFISCIFSISVRNDSKMTEMGPKKVQNRPFSPQKGDLIKLENFKARTYIPQHGDLIQLEILRPGLYQSNGFL